MREKISTDEVVTQGDEYTRAKAGELDKDGDAQAPDAKPGAALPAAKLPGVTPGADKTDG